ncbi:Vacuolar iron transporter-like protein 4 [Hibiscus syriacus]|uniref:Vacuolar iron transporter n=1 Tax=Hibiscus syriacus TaxID=106335 RepID=A0A6A2Z6R4_HIBSY|nr:Vacuolar iron transporter-like protein 4 [Hibiscus syriacus]
MVSPQTLRFSSLDNFVIGTEENQFHEPGIDEFDYSMRGQWLRAAVLGANDGLVSVASLMMGVGSVKEDVKAMIVAGFAGADCVVASVTLVVLGVVGALLGGTPVGKSSARVLVCGWMVMATTYGFTKMIGSGHAMQI